MRGISDHSAIACWIVHLLRGLVPKLDCVTPWVWICVERCSDTKACLVEGYVNGSWTCKEAHRAHTPFVAFGHGIHRELEKLNLSIWEWWGSSIWDKNGTWVEVCISNYHRNSSIQGNSIIVNNTACGCWQEWVKRNWGHEGFMESCYRTKTKSTHELVTSSNLMELELEKPPHNPGSNEVDRKGVVHSKYPMISAASALKSWDGLFKYSFRGWITLKLLWKSRSIRYLSFLNFSDALRYAESEQEESDESFGEHLYLFIIDCWLRWGVFIWATYWKLRLKLCFHKK